MNEYPKLNVTVEGVTCKTPFPGLEEWIAALQHPNYEHTRCMTHALSVWDTCKGTDAKFAGTPLGALIVSQNRAGERILTWEKLSETNDAATYRVTTSAPLSDTAIGDSVLGEGKGGLIVYGDEGCTQADQLSSTNPAYFLLGPNGKLPEGVKVRVSCTRVPLSSLFLINSMPVVTVADIVHILRKVYDHMPKGMATPLKQIYEQQDEAATSENKAQADSTPDCRCIDCGGDQPGHDSTCSFMRELHCVGCPDCQ